MRDYAGITFIELLISIVIIGIIASITLIAVQYLIRQQDIQTSQQGMMNALYYARSEAISLQQPVSLCPSADKTICSDDWNKPLIIFTQSAVLQNKTILHVIPPILEATIDANFSNVQDQKQITFWSDGSVSNGNIRYCQHHRGWKIVLNTAGRIQAQNVEYC